MVWLILFVVEVKCMFNFVYYVFFIISDSYVVFVRCRRFVGYVCIFGFNRFYRYDLMIFNVVDI